MTVSRDSLRQFLNCFLGIDENHFSYHQWLTFGRDVSEREAKDLLNRLRQNLSRRKKLQGMTAIYVRERQPKSGHIHFHVRLMFFGDSLPFPRSLMVRELGKVVFAAWNALNGGRLNRRGTAMRERPHRAWYLLEKLELPQAGQTTARLETSWWGRWNRKVLRQHYSKPSAQIVADAIRDRFPRFKSPKSERPYYSMAWVREKRREVELWLDTTGDGPDWESYKQRETGRSQKVSNRDYYQFVNGWNPWKKRRQRKRKLLTLTREGVRPDDEIF